MSFKLHLAVVSLIILVVMMIWEFTGVGSKSAAPQASQGVARKIIVVHASLGLNCRGLMIDNQDTPSQVFNNSSKENAKIREDNVFGPVSLMCNGAIECEVSANDPALGEDPAPDCTPKTLEVEYRCFSYDRPWLVKTNGGSVKLQCNKSRPPITGR